MSGNRPASKDAVQENDYGSDDNEIDRINREKKEILLLSMDDIKMIKKVSASVVRAMGKIVVPEDESSDDDDDDGDQEMTNSDDEKVLYNFRGKEINQKYKIHTHAGESLFKIRDRLIKFDDNIASKFLPVKQESVHNRTSSTLYRPFLTCLKSGIRMKLKALFDCLSVNYEYTLTLEAIKVVITLTKDYNRVVKKLAAIKLMKKSEQSNAFSGMGLISEYMTDMIELKATLASEACGQVITKFFLDAYDKFEKSKTSKNSDIKVLTVDLYRTFLLMESLLQIDVLDNISKASDRHKVMNAHIQLVVSYKPLLNFVPLLLSEVKHDNDSLNAYGLWVSIMKITGYITRDHSARDMLKVFTDGGITDSSQISTDMSSNTQVVQPLAPPPKKVPEHNKGILRTVLSRERANRMKPMDSSSRHGMARFAISMSTPISANSDTANTNEDKAKPILPRANKVIVRDICGSTSGKSAAPESKINKKNLTFAADDIIRTTNISVYSDSHSRGRACAIAANIIDRICSSNALYMLIERVFEDRLRDPDNEKVTIADGTEFIFYRIVTLCLQYTRLKLEIEKGKLSHSPYDENGSIIEWVPNLRPVVQGLTRTMINRVVGALEILEGDGKSASKDCSNVQYPMELFKEIICYFGKVMFASANTGHHDTALSQLYYIFYRPSERNDPLPKLVKEWKPGTYSRQHLNILVELIHETMKTLDIAHSKYKTDTVEDKRSSKSKLKDGRLGDYIMGCRRFSPDDYFKRLVSNHSVNIYTRLLGNCSDNDKRTNHYIFSFLQRTCNFTLEQDCPTSATPSDSTGSSEGAVQSSVNLGYLLFNVRTLGTISTIINDVTIASNPSHQQIVKLSNSIIRKFFEVACKNRCLFVEGLFRHPHSHEFILEIDSIYKAPEYVRSKRNSIGRYDQDERVHSPVAATADWDYDSAPVKSKLEDLGDEFDEDNLPETFYRTKKSNNSRRARGSRRQYNSSDSDEDGGSKKRSSSRQWTKEEDRILKEQYKVYAGSRSAFDNIAQHEALVAIGRNRTSKSVARRIRELKLHLTYNDGISDEEEQSDDEKSFHDSASSDNDAEDGDKSDDGQSDVEEVGKEVDDSQWSVTEQALLKELYQKYLSFPDIFNSIITDTAYASYNRTAEEVEDKIFSLGLQHDDSVPNEDSIEFNVEQDLQIMTLYAEFKGNPSVLEFIAADTVFSNGDANGREITADDIARRVFDLGIDPCRTYEPKPAPAAATVRAKKQRKEKVKKSKKRKSSKRVDVDDAPIKSHNSSPGTDVEARYSDEEQQLSKANALANRVFSAGRSEGDEPRKSKKSRLSKSSDRPVDDDEADIDFFNDAVGARDADIIKVNKKRGRIDSDEDE